MIRFIDRRWFIYLVRIGIGIIFIYAGFTKMLEPQAFADSVASFKILPDWMINIFALTLPPFEILTGLLMLGRRNARSATLCIVILCMVFIIAMGQAIFRGLNVDCGCFGSGSSPMNVWTSIMKSLVLGYGVFWVYCVELRTLKRTSTRIN